MRYVFHTIIILETSGVPGGLVGGPRVPKINFVGSSLTQCILSRKDLFLHQN